MPITLAFTGRFLATQPSDKGKAGQLDLLALNMQWKDKKAARHRVMIAIPSVALADADQLKAFPEALQVMAGRDGVKSPHVVIDLEGWDVSIEGATGTFTWAKNTLKKLANLGEWERSARDAKNSSEPDAVLDSKHLNPTSEAVNSRIQVAAGVGSVPASARRYSPVSVASNVAKDKPKELADCVRVKIPDATLTLKLVARDSKRTEQTISITDEHLEGDAVIGFSNLCLSAPRKGPDEEFSAFYDLLQNRPKQDARLIPERADGQGGFTIECFILAFVVCSAIVLL